DRGREVSRCGARGARERDRQLGGLGEAQAEEGGAPLVDVGVAADAPVASQREDEWRGARARRGAGVRHPAARELVHERAQEDVGVGGWSQTRDVPETIVLLHGFAGTRRAWEP